MNILTNKAENITANKIITPNIGNISDIGLFSPIPPASTIPIGLAIYVTHEKKLNALACISLGVSSWIITAFITETTLTEIPISIPAIKRISILGINIRVIPTLPAKNPIANI